MEKEILEKFNTHDIIVGIDEVGRGPIAGPVTVGAFALQKEYYIEVIEELAGITDSKKMSEKKREAFTEKIRELKKQGKVHVVIASVPAEVIDKQGIIKALSAALNHSLKKILREFKNPYIYLDGSLHAPDKFEQETIIKGDSKNWLIGAASVVAKVTRDNLMKEYGKEFPEYGFERHKGYGTKAHYQAIQKEGMTTIHRRTWIRV